MLAIFDMDGTLMLSSNVIETYLWMRLQELSTRGRPRRRGGADGGPRCRRWSAGGAPRAQRLPACWSTAEYAGAELAEQLEAMVDAVRGLARPHPPELTGGRAPGPRAPERPGTVPCWSPAPIRPLTRPLRAAVRPCRGRRARHRRPTGCVYRSTCWLPRPWSGRPGPPGCCTTGRPVRGVRPLPQLRLRRLPLRPAAAALRGAAHRGLPRRAADARGAGAELAGGDLGRPARPGGLGGLLRRLVPTRAGDTTGVGLP